MNHTGGQYQYLDAAHNLTCGKCANGKFSALGLFCDDCGPGSFTEDRVGLC